MRTASFRQTPLTERVYFGRPAAEVIAEEMEARRLGRALIVASTTLAGTTPVIGQLIERLGGRMVEVQTGISQHSPNDEILRLADRMRAVEPDVMITIGGGSVVDSAKVARLAVGASAEDRDGLRSLRSIMGEDGVRRSPPCSVASTPMISVATTLSAAEYTDMAGSTDPQIGMKDIYKHPRLAPEVVVLDPAVAVHTPQKIWAAAGARAVDHAVETVCSHLSDHYSNGPALHAIRLLRDALPESFADQNDLAARLRCLQAAWLAADHAAAGIGMGASHGIGYVVGSRHGIAHGHTSAILLPAVLAYNFASNCMEQAMVAEAMGAPEGSASTLVSALFARLGLPARLADVGVKAEHHTEIARIAIETGVVRNNPRALRSEADVMEILAMAA